MAEILLIAIALAIDCFTVSIAAGVTARRIIWKPMTLMTLAFGIFQGGMTAIGYFGMEMLARWIEKFDHWLAFILLCYLGFNMISTAWNKEESANMDLLALRNIPTLAVATSIDALAVSHTFPCRTSGRHSINRHRCQDSGRTPILNIYAEKDLRA